jgi:chemotaxis protein methyltransferase CheR
MTRQASLPQEPSPPGTGERSVGSDSDYDYLRQLVLSRTANVIDAARTAHFETRLKPVVQSAGASNVEGLVNMLRTDPPEHLHRAVAEAMTITETSFFRDRRIFDVLRDNILPRLIEANAATRRLRLWSAAGSTGQEAYSMAMLLCEHFPLLAGWDVKIIATDISQQVIEVARRGRYRRLEVNRGLPARMLVKYLQRDGEEWEVTPRLRSLCDFQYANLCTALPKLPVFDLVLLRNVLLYFPLPSRSTVFCGVHRQMAPGGYLVLGASEQAEDSTNLFRTEFAQDCYYYRPVAPC